MKAKDIHYSGVHPNCPFTKEQIDEFRAMLYGVASANNRQVCQSYGMGCPDGRPGRRRQSESDNPQRGLIWQQEQLNSEASVLANGNMAT